MDILILIVITTIALSMLLGRPLKITITHKTEVPPITVLEEKDSDKIAKEMKENALNIMEKFNKEWGGLTDDGEE